MGRYLGGLAREIDVEAALALVLHEGARRAAPPVGPAHDAAARPEDDDAAAHNLLPCLALQIVPGLLPRPRLGAQHAPRHAQPAQHLVLPARVRVHLDRDELPAVEEAAELVGLRAGDHVRHLGAGDSGR